MAFDNTVPYTISGTIDTNTNLITFVVSLYELDRNTNLYDNLQWTETFAIPASACGYKRNTNQVFIVTNESQDQFSIYQGWYDAEADITYTSITSALDDMVDALIAQQTGGGSTTIYTELTEAAAITAIGAQGLVPGRMYRIELDGTSGGNNGDMVYTQAIITDVFSREVQLFDINDTAVYNVTGIFDENGWAQISPRRYVAILNQSGTSAPVATVLENTLGGTPVWSYNSAGSYTLTLTGAFTTNKTYHNISLNSDGNFGPADDITAYVIPLGNTLNVITTSTSTPTDEVLYNATLKIEVYP